jgi:hypothetical protein
VIAQPFHVVSKSFREVTVICRPDVRREVDTQMIQIAIVEVRLNDGFLELGARAVGKVIVPPIHQLAVKLLAVDASGVPH